MGVLQRRRLFPHGDGDRIGTCVYAKVLGTIEAKPEDRTLIGVEERSAKYVVGLPDGLPSYSLPLPFAYESTGVVTQFTNRLDPDEFDAATATKSTWKGLPDWRSME